MNIILQVIFRGRRMSSSACRRSVSVANLSFLVDTRFNWDVSMHYSYPSDAARTGGMSGHASLPTDAWTALRSRYRISFFRKRSCRVSIVFNSPDERPNAEFMSLTNKLPLLKVDDHFVAGFDAIASYARLRVSNITMISLCFFSLK